jgi:phosphoribosylformylglycinamidine synthase
VGAAIEVPDPCLTIALFHEGPSRILVSTATPEAVEKIARDNGVEAVRIGVTMKEKLRIDHNSVTLIDCAIGKLREARENALENQLSSEIHV